MRRKCCREGQPAVGMYGKENRHWRVDGWGQDATVLCGLLSAFDDVAWQPGIKRKVRWWAESQADVTCPACKELLNAKT